MTPESLIAHFGGAAATARALGIKQPSVSEWKARGRVPIGRQYQAHVLSNGALTVDPELQRGGPTSDAE